jgi:acyl-CoA dehydrogenase family protein 9
MPIEESFSKSLFHGAIPEEMIFPFPESTAEERDHAALLIERVRDLGRRAIDPARIDREATIPPEALDALRRAGVFGMNIPQSYGGAGLSLGGQARVIQELAAVDGSVAVTVAAHGLLAANALLLFGSDAQRARWLPAMATGERIGSFALSEPGAGSDAGGIRTQATLRGGGVWTLHGAKSWVTNGAVADLAVVVARTTERTQHARPKLTAFVLERGDGYTLADAPPKLGVRGASTPTLTLPALRLTSDRVLGDVGRGYKVAMEVLSRGRVGLAAGCVGAARRLVRMSIERATARSAFGRSIAEFGLIKDKLARMMTETWAMESMVYLTTGIADAKVPDWSLESAMCKVFATEALWRIASEALQIAGGNGASQAEPWERMLRDARVYLLMEGTNETLRAYIALAGLQGPSRQIAEVARAMREPIKGFGLMYDFAMQRARTALGRERMNRGHASLRREVVMLEENVAALGRSADKVLRRHGKDIAEMQFTQRRLADIATDLFGLAACIARCTRAIDRKGESGARRETDLTAAFANMAERRLRANIAAFDANDDELLKSIAAQGCADGAYSFDLP